MEKFSSFITEQKEESYRLIVFNNSNEDVRDVGKRVRPDFKLYIDSAKKVGLYNLKYKYHADYDYFYRMIVKHKLKGVGTKKNELFGYFRRGGFSSKIKFKDHFFEEIYLQKLELLLPQHL